MRGRPRYARTPHRLDALGRRSCRLCKAVWPCAAHPIEAHGLVELHPELRHAFSDDACKACGLLICICEPAQRCIIGIDPGTDSFTVVTLARRVGGELVVDRVQRLPACTCGGAMCGSEQETYHCPGCDRDVPLCFGAADERPELCDDCWLAEVERGVPALPPGWTLEKLSPRCRQYNHVSGVWVFGGEGASWLVNSLDEKHPAHGDITPYPSALQAMAAALGYRLFEDEAGYYFGPNGSCGVFKTADDAARAACEHHARENGYA